MCGARKRVVFCFDWDGRKAYFLRRISVEMAGGKRRGHDLSCPTLGSERGKVFVKMRNRLDAAVVVFESQVFVGSVCVFVGKAEADQHARYFECVVHLGHERDGTTFANKDGLFA